jgi:hypothetical protein
MLSVALALCAAAQLAAANPQPATRLRVHGSNVHPASVTASTRFAVDLHTGPELLFTWAAQHARRGASQVRTPGRAVRRASQLCAGVC